MREIVLDTETTGLDPLLGHRIVEIGCVELLHGIPTGNNLHRYINPGRAMPNDAGAVHGLTDAMLADKPAFEEICDELLDYLGDAPLVIHNAAFDMNFLNAELVRADRPMLPVSRALCTLEMTRAQFPGAPASLDALCRRFGIDAAHRTLHGALLDAELLALVYLELRGGRQTALVLDMSAPQRQPAVAAAARPVRPPRPHAPSEEELALHQAFLAQLSNPLWLASA